MAALLQCFDMAVTVQPPQGHFEPVPLTLGSSWQPNDVRLLMVSAAGVGQGSAYLPMPMDPDPPTGYTSAYTLNSGVQTLGAYYRYLALGDGITNVAWPKPPNWQHFMWATLTARGVSPTNVPVAGKLSTSYRVGDATASVASVTVPAAGTMVFFLGTFADPEGGWPSWPSSLGMPTGWTPMVGTDKSGINYFPYDSNPALLVVGKSYSGSGSTGTVSFPIGSGAPAFSGLYFFIRAASDVSVTVGAA